LTFYVSSKTFHLVQSELAVLRRRACNYYLSQPMLISVETYLNLMFCLKMLIMASP